MSFNRKHNSFEEPRKHCRAVLGVPQFINPGLRRKHDVGLAFFLDYYKHSGSTWSLHGEGQQLQFDTSRYAGFLVWDHKPRELGAKTFEDRAEDARRFLKTYNQWANGETYWYSLEDVDGNPLSSSDGYYDVDLIVTDITPYLGRGDQVKIRGDAAAVAHRLKLPAGVLLVDEFTTELEAAGAESGRAGTETTNQEEV